MERNVAINVNASKYEDLEKLLESIAADLELPESMFELVRERYESMSRWLERDNSSVKEYDPVIYPQGSFALGTVVRPLSEVDEFDIDLVCQLGRRKSDVTQRDLKFDIGSEVRGYVVSNGFKKQVEEWDKCWTVEYSDQGYVFKMDIVPALPDNETFSRLIRESPVSFSFAKTAIGITDREHPSYRIVTSEWPRGNPKGYAEWFRNRMKVQFERRKTAYVARMTESRAAEEVPDYKIKTPLQQVIQLIKRHRDSFFELIDHSPSSIVVTTLAAQAYRNEDTLVAAMDGILARFKLGVKRSLVEVRIENPVDPTENFAKEWNDDPRFSKAFVNWLARLQQDWEILKSSSGANFSDKLAGCFGSTTVNRAISSIERSKSLLPNTAAGSLLSRFNVPHRVRPESKWTVKSNTGAYIKSYYRDGERWIGFGNGSRPLPKKRKLRFVARTAIPAPYQVHWQIVNSGEEATNNGGLRGGIFKASLSSTQGLTHDESTLYEGSHWVQCYIIKNGYCVAQSSPFVVNIS